MAIFQGSEDQNNKSILKNIKAKSVLRYTMMPEILPRIRALGLHFGHFAYLLALVFSSARLIPATHPVLNAANIGQFGVRQVIAMAANNITWSRKNIDQIAIFSAIVIGLIMIVIQAGLIAVAALVGMNPAEAQTGSFFTTPDPENDAAFIFLAQVFGDLNGFWGETMVAPGVDTPIHEAVYGMLSLYSMAMMVIAVIIVLYYIMTVVGEAAKTGTPFGSRFNSLWAPIRLVVALGLLVPMSSGLNSAQYLTLWMAKMGSGLGSQAWIILSEELISVSADKYVLQEIPLPDYYMIAMDIFRAQVCMHAHNDQENFSGTEPSAITLKDIAADDYEVNKVWITRDEDDYSNLVNCGGIVLGLSAPGVSNNADNTLTPEVVPTDQIIDSVARNIDALINHIDPKAKAYAEYKVAGGRPGSRPEPVSSFAADIYAKSKEVSENIKTDVEAIYSGAVKTKVEEVLARNLQQGWITAGLWYIRIGEIIQDVESPKTELIPEVYYNSPQSQSNGYVTTFNAGKKVIAVNDAAVHVEEAIEFASNYYSNAAPPLTATPSQASNATEVIRKAVAGEYVAQACDEVSWFKQQQLKRMECLIYQLFVPHQLVILRSQDYKTMDPMTMMMSAGESMVSKSIGALVVAFGTGVAGPILSAAGFPFAGAIGGFLNAVSGFAMLIAFFGLASGFVLFFLLPIFPFMYFFFAVVSWVMEIFEAVIAMPLWALAHLQIAGDGMPGPTALNGYHLLLSILLRPVLIILGLTGAFLIFGAGVYLLQVLYDPLLNVITDGDMWGFEIMIHTAIFTYLAYMLGLISFKMVDTVPQSILRWLGSGAQTFSDGKGDIGQSSQSAIAGVIAGNQALQAIGGAGSKAGSGIANSINSRRSNRASGRQHQDLIDAIRGGNRAPDPD